MVWTTIRLWTSPWPRVVKYLSSMGGVAKSRWRRHRAWSESTLEQVCVDWHWESLRGIDRDAVKSPRFRLTVPFILFRMRNWIVARLVRRKPPSEREANLRPQEGRAIRMSSRFQVGSPEKLPAGRSPAVSWRAVFGSEFCFRKTVAADKSLLSGDGRSDVDGCRSQPQTRDRALD